MLSQKIYLNVSDADNNNNELFKVQSLGGNGEIIVPQNVVFRVEGSADFSGAQNFNTASGNNNNNNNNNNTSNTIINFDTFDSDFDNSQTKIFDIKNGSSNSLFRLDSNNNELNLGNMNNRLDQRLLNGNLSIGLMEKNDGIKPNDQNFDIGIRNQNRNARILLSRQFSLNDKYKGGIIQGLFDQHGKDVLKLSCFQDETSNGGNYNSNYGLFLRDDGRIRLNDQPDDTEDHFIISNNPEDDVNSRQTIQRIRNKSNIFDDNSDDQINFSKLIFEAGVFENPLNIISSKKNSEITMGTTFTSINGGQNIGRDYFFIDRSGNANVDFCIRGDLDENRTTNITKRGFVGIGTNTPNYKLEVNGDISATGSVLSNGMTLTSDERIKKNIKPLSNENENGDDEIDRFIEMIEPKKFQCIESGENKIGFIAQNLKSIDSNLVRQSNRMIPNIMKKGLIKLKNDNLNEKQKKEWEKWMNKKKQNEHVKNQTNTVMCYEIEWENDQYFENELRIVVCFGNEKTKGRENMEMKLKRNEKTGKYEFKQNIFISLNELFIKGTYVNDFLCIDPVGILAKTVACTKKLYKQNKELKQCIESIKEKINQNNNGN